MTQDRLSNANIRWLAAACAVVAANGYYVHPIIARIAEDFGVSTGMVGAVPALNQIGLAIGICLLLPLGDRVSNRRLVQGAAFAQTLALWVMVLASDFLLFLAASTLLGFFTIAPYLLPAYTSKRVAAERLGHVTALLTTGVIAGVLLSRTGSGVIAEHLGWRNVYVVAGSLMALVTLFLPRIMTAEQELDGVGGAPTTSYPALLASLISLVRTHPQVAVSGCIQALSFGIFLCVWLGIGLHLTGPTHGLGTDAVGLLAAFSVLNLLTTPRLGRWADRIGAQKARLMVCWLQLAGVLCLFLTEQSYWWLLLPTSLMNIAGPIIDVTGRMTALSGNPEVRTRLMTVYIIIMFTGAGMASWLGTLAFDLGGWWGTCTISLAFSLLVLLLARTQSRR